MERPASAVRWAKRFVKPATHYMARPHALFWREREVVTADGLRLWCHPENLIERTIIDTGLWDPWETAVVKTLVGPEAIVMDVGANVGYFTLLMVKQVGTHGQVHAFEPTQYAYGRLQRNLALNPHLPTSVVRLVKKGLLANAERRRVALEARFSQRVLAHTEPEEIEFTSLDAYREDQGLQRVDFIKIDVDGHDVSVMQGASETLRSCQPLVLAEFCERVLLENGSRVADYVELLRSHGYDRFMSEDEGEPQPLARVADEPAFQHGSRNLLLLPEGKSVPTGIAPFKRPALQSSLRRGLTLGRRLRG